MKQINVHHLKKIWSYPLVRWDNWKIGRKIKGSFLVLIIIIIITGVFSVITLKKAISSLEDITQDLTPVIEDLTSLGLTLTKNAEKQLR